MGQKTKILAIAGAVLLAIVSVLLVYKFAFNKKVEVKFDTKGGVAIESVKLKKGEKLELDEEPTREGYEFEGWYLDGKLFDLDTPIKKNIVLKARWTEKEASEEIEEIEESEPTEPSSKTPKVETIPATKSCTSGSLIADKCRTEDVNLFVCSKRANPHIVDGKVVGCVSHLTTKQTTVPCRQPIGNEWSRAVYADQPGVLAGCYFVVDKWKDNKTECLNGGKKWATYLDINLNEKETCIDLSTKRTPGRCGRIENYVSSVYGLKCVYRQLLPVNEDYTCGANGYKANGTCYTAGQDPVLTCPDGYTKKADKCTRTI